jgi:hypothetical protein
MKVDGSNGLLYLRPSNELLGLRHQKAQNWGRNAFLVPLLPPFQRKKRSGGEYVQLARRFGKSAPNMLWLGRRIQRGVLGKSAMIAPTLSPSRHDQEKKLMEFFFSRQDKSLLLVMDSRSHSGHVFKVMAEETWTLIWSGIVTKEFMESSAWKWEVTDKDPDTFPGGWPKHHEN